VYDTGYAFLMDNEGRFVYHPEMIGDSITADFNDKHVYLYEKSLLSAEGQSVEAYQWNGIDKKMTAQKLRNGMIFTVCVAESEIKQPQQNILMHTVLVIVVILSVFVFATVSITKVIVRLMYTDSMTRVGNKTAYTECVDAIHRRIENKENFSFVVIVTDINDLKKVNDTYGHEYGDLLIQNGAATLKKIWDSKFIFRIGGDEFVVIYTDVIKDTVEKEMQSLDKILDEFNMQNDSKELHLQMAIGMAVYDPESDIEYMDVFRRADSAMYENKKFKKESKR
jgi:diguanylate cyclase (GGDEF)-like protein